MSVGSRTISGMVWGTRPLIRSQVASTSSTRSSTKTERFWPGHRPGVAPDELRERVCALAEQLASWAQAR
jgi:hypothetical protein